MLINFAPLSAANVMAFAISENEPDPVQSRTFRGRIFAAGAIPATPAPLFIAAATVPDTWVPCAKGDMGANQASSSGVVAVGHEELGEVRNTCCDGVLPGA